jgi:anti-sigma28 factor (negative regulator of flagellin synthesis)
MTINEISNSGIPVQPGQPRKVKEEQQARASSSRDKVELSEEAKAMFESEQSRRLAEIQRRIEEGFYKRREVMERVVDAILRDIE